MKKLLVALIASAFATVAFAQDKKDEKKKAEATTAPAAAPAKKDAAPAAKNDAPAAKKNGAPKKDAAPAAKKDDKMASGDKPKDDTKKDVKKP